MKKFLLYIVLTLCLVLTAGCKTKNRELTIEDVKNSTILVKNDGTVQAATIETFEKNNYSLDELKAFITKEIGKYNQDNEADSIVINTLEVKDKNAVLILNYKSLENYTAFNKVKASFTTTADAKSSKLELPDVYVNVKDGAYTSPDVALKNSKYKVLVLNEKTDVIVDGKVKFFANGTLHGKSNFETGSAEPSVIIYKP